MRTEPVPSPSASPAPWWARALTGAIVGALAGIVLAAIIAAIALVLMLVMPGVGAGQIWRAAGTVMILAFVTGVVRSAWYSVRGRHGRQETEAVGHAGDARPNH